MAELDVKVNESVRLTPINSFNWSMKVYLILSLCDKAIKINRFGHNFNKRMIFYFSSYNIRIKLECTVFNFKYA